MLIDDRSEKKKQLKSKQRRKQIIIKPLSKLQLSCEINRFLIPKFCIIGTSGMRLLGTLQPSETYLN